jgi:hypothetical protein
MSAILPSFGLTSVTWQSVIVLSVILLNVAAHQFENDDKNIDHQNLQIQI